MRSFVLKMKAGMEEEGNVEWDEYCGTDGFYVSSEMEGA